MRLSNQKEVDLSSYDNSWYIQGRSLIIRITWYFVNILFFKSSFSVLSYIKVELLKIFGAKVGHGVVIKPCVNIKYPWNLEIGDNVWIGENVWIDNLSMIIIKNNACISQGAMLLCGNHNYKLKSFDLIVRPIVIEDGAWVGAQSLVCPGVTLKSHSVLSVCSVATKDLDAYTIYRGNPAQKISERTIHD